MLSLLELKLQTAIESSTYGEVRLLLEDAEAILEGLQEHEPVKAVRFTNYNGFPVYFCGKCDKNLKRLTMNYCPNCGREIDWSEWDGE